MARFALVACAAATAALLLGVAAADVASIITQDVYNQMLPNRDNTQCPANGFYTYDAFIQAVNFFPGFGTGSSTDELNKRELAAFFGQTSHETTGQ
jgi:basic endochitinase B